jgi:uncharacterized protein YciI
MRHFVIEVTYKIPVEQLGDTIAEHRSFLQEGFDRGWLLLSGPKVPRTGGMVIARAPSQEDLEQFFTQDPYQIKGLAEYRIIEFTPVKNQPFLKDWLD